MKRIPNTVKDLKAVPEGAIIRSVWGYMFKKDVGRWLYLATAFYSEPEDRTEQQLLHLSQTFWFLIWEPKTDKRWPWNRKHHEP